MHGGVAVQQQLHLVGRGNLTAHHKHIGTNELLLGKRLDFLTIDHNRFGYIYEIRGLLSPYCFFSGHKYSNIFFYLKYLRRKVVPTLPSAAANGSESLRYGAVSGQRCVSGIGVGNRAPAVSSEFRTSVRRNDADPLGGCTAGPIRPLTGTRRNRTARQPEIPHGTIPQDFGCALCVRALRHA